MTHVDEESDQDKKVNMLIVGDAGSPINSRKGNNHLTPQEETQLIND